MLIFEIQQMLSAHWSLVMDADSHRQHPFQGGHVAGESLPLIPPLRLCNKPMKRAYATSRYAEGTFYTMYPIANSYLILICYVCDD